MAPVVYGVYYDVYDRPVSLSQEKHTTVCRPHQASKAGTRRGHDIL